MNARKSRYILFLSVVLSVALGPSLCFSQDQPLDLELTRKDRILILAPHPDDEAIGTGGLIQTALHLGLPLKIAYFTNGDNNELAFIVYEKRVVFLKKAFVHMGEVRRKESIEAMKYLGVPEKDLIFLGYPDFGTFEIFTKYWNLDRPYRSMLTRVTEVPYPECLTCKAPYVGQSILKDLKTILLQYRPTKIFVSSPVDVNRDHRALSLFLQVALWDLEGKIPKPEVLPYLIHVVGWPRPKGFHPDLELSPPANLKESEIRWGTLELTPSEIDRKKKAVSFYKSQIEYDPPYLYSFVRRNEMFGDYPVIKLKKQDTPETLWHDAPMVKPLDEDAQRPEISKLDYAAKDGDLFVKIDLKRRFDKNFGVFVYLFGYSKAKDFAVMPKISLSIGMRGVKVKDKRTTLPVGNVKLAFKGRSLIIKVPMSLLGDPERLLAAVKTSAKDLSLDDTAWRAIMLE